MMYFRGQSRPRSFLTLHSFAPLSAGVSVCGAQNVELCCWREEQWFSVDSSRRFSFRRLTLCILAFLNWQGKAARMFFPLV